jgi:hypothetical protein
METLMKCARHEKLNPNGFTTTLLGINSTDTQEREVQRQYREQFFADLKARLAANSGSFAKITRGETSSQGEVPAARSFQSDSWAAKDTQKEIEPVLPSNGWNTTADKLAPALSRQTTPTAQDVTSAFSRQTTPTADNVTPVGSRQSTPTADNVAAVSSRQTTPTSELPANQKVTAEQAIAPPQVDQPSSNEQPLSDTNTGSPDAGSANMIENDIAPLAVSEKASSLALQNSPPISLPQALQILMESLDLELEAVSQAGAQAFSDRDFARAQAILEFSSRLSDFRVSAKQLYDDYQGES